MRYSIASFFSVYMDKFSCGIAKLYNNTIYLLFQGLSRPSTPLRDDTKLEWIAIITVQQKQLFLLFFHFSHFTAAFTDRVTDTARPKSLKGETGSITFREQKKKHTSPNILCTMCFHRRQLLNNPMTFIFTENLGKDDF